MSNGQGWRQLFETLVSTNVEVMSLKTAFPVSVQLYSTTLFDDYESLLKRFSGITPWGNLLRTVDILLEVVSHRPPHNKHLQAFQQCLTSMSWKLYQAT